MYSVDRKNWSSACLAEEQKCERFLLIYLFLNGKQDVFFFLLRHCPPSWPVKEQMHLVTCTRAPRRCLTYRGIPSAAALPQDAQYYSTSSARHKLPTFAKKERENGKETRTSMYWLAVPGTLWQSRGQRSQVTVLWQIIFYWSRKNIVNPQDARGYLNSANV